MKIILRLRAESAPMARQFYEDELRMFRLVGTLWESACTLRATASEDIELELADFHNPPSDAALFILTTDDCNREFKRLVNTHFASGGRVVPNKHGRLDVFEYPAGANFMMEDPSGNRFLIHEDFGAAPEDTLRMGRNRDGF